MAANLIAPVSHHYDDVLNAVSLHTRQDVREKVLLADTNEWFGEFGLGC